MNPTPSSKEGWTILTPSPHSPSLPPCQRSLHAAAVVKDSLYVFGGYDGQNRVNDFYQYHFPSGIWREIVTVGGNVLVGGTHASFGNNNNQGAHADMAAVGGANGTNNAAGWNNNNASRQRLPSGNNITATGNVPTPRDRHAAVVHNSTFYIFGGFDGTSRVSDLYGFDVDRLVWREVRPAVVGNGPPMDDDDRGGGVPAAVVGNHNNNRRIVGFQNNNIVDAGGGGVDGGNNNVNMQGWHNHVNHRGRENGLEVDFHQELIQQQHQHQPPSPRHSHSAVVYKDGMYVFGGYDGSYRSDFHEFDFVRSTWRPVFASGRTPRARYRATACVHEDMMILFGGHDGTRHLSGENKVWCMSRLRMLDNNLLTMLTSLL